MTNFICESDIKNTIISTNQINQITKRYFKDSIKLDSALYIYIRILENQLKENILKNKIKNIKSFDSHIQKSLLNDRNILIKEGVI